MNTYIEFMNNKAGIISRLNDMYVNNAEQDDLIAFADLLHECYCDKEHINDEKIDDQYCAWLDEELEDALFDCWLRPAHYKWENIAQELLNKNITPQKVIEQYERMNPII